MILAVESGHCEFSTAGPSYFPFMYSISSGAAAQALGAPPYLDSPEYTSWFASHTEWRRDTVMGVAWSIPDGVWTPVVGVENGAVPAPAPSRRSEPTAIVPQIVGPAIATEYVSAPGLPPLPAPPAVPTPKTYGSCTGRTYGS